MFVKSFTKRTALIAIASLGFGLLSAVPAFAVGIEVSNEADETFLASPTASTTVGVAAETTFTVKGSESPLEGDYIFYTLQVTSAPTGSALVPVNTDAPELDVTPASASSAAVGKFKFKTGSAETASDWALTTTDITDGSVTVEDGILMDTAESTTDLDAVRGTISINPDKVGRYVVRLTIKPYTTDTPDVANTERTRDFTVDAFGQADVVTDIASLNVNAVGANYSLVQREDVAFSVNVGYTVGTVTSIDANEEVTLKAVFTSKPALSTLVGVGTTALDAGTATNGTAGSVASTDGNGVAAGSLIATPDNGVALITDTSIGSIDFTPDVPGT